MKKTIENVVVLCLKLAFITIVTGISFISLTLFAGDL